MSISGIPFLGSLGTNNLFTKGIDGLFYKSTYLEDTYDNLKNLIERMTSNKW